MFEKIIKKCTQSQVHYSFYNSISEVPIINWNEFDIKNNLFFSYEYLKTIEKTLNKDITFKYIVFYNDDKHPIGFAVTQLVAFNTKELDGYNLPCTLTDSIKNSFLKKLDVNILVCGNIFSCGEHGFVFNKKAIAPNEAYLCLANALLDTKKSKNAIKSSYVLVKEFWPTSFNNSDNFKTRGFRELHIDVNMVVQIQPEWNTFNDYIASMRTKYRSRAKKVLINSDKLILKRFSHNDITNYEDQINQLYSSVIDNAYFKLGQINAQVLKELKKSLRSHFIFNAYFLENELIGFSTCFIQEKTIESFHVGFNYNYKQSHNIYQRILYDYVQLAIEYKVNELHLGRTAEIIKSCVGAKPVNMKLYIRHRNSISNTLLKPFADSIKPSNYEIRSPFKKNK